MFVLGERVKVNWFVSDRARLGRVILSSFIVQQKIDVYIPMQQFCLCLLRRRRENQKIDVYLCNNVFVFYVEDVNITLVNVYGPNIDDDRFFVELHNLVLDHGEEPYIIGGDLTQL